MALASSISKQKQMAFYQKIFLFESKLKSFKFIFLVISSQQFSNQIPVSGVSVYLKSVKFILSKLASHLESTKRNFELMK